MSSPADFDRSLSAWLDEQAPMREPEGLTYAVLARTRRTRRIPGWATLERWFPMQTTYKFGAVPRTAIILVTLALLTALMGIAIALGASPKLPLPIGPAVNGLIAYDSNGDIWVTKLDGTERKQLTTGPDVDQGPIFSWDGLHIAYWSRGGRDGKTSLVVMDPNGEDRQALVGGLEVPQGKAGVREPTWSHDSQRLAYPDKLANGLSSISRISVVSLADPVPHELARNAQGPTWSPDDATIAYRGGGSAGAGPSGPAGVYLVSSSGGKSTPLAVTADDIPDAFIYPQWSPDAKWLVYSAGNPFVFLTSVENPSPQAISPEAETNVLPVWSPDGSNIAYHHEGQMVITDAHGSNQRELVHPPVLDRFPTWSPDGNRLIGYLPDGSGMLVVDPFGNAEPVTLSAPGEVGYSSWQRLAP